MLLCSFSKILASLNLDFFENVFFSKLEISGADWELAKSSSGSRSLALNAQTRPENSWWIVTAYRQIPTQTLTLLPDRWGNNHRKVRRLVHWDLSLIGKQKLPPKAKQRKNLFTISYQQEGAQSLSIKQGFITSNGSSGRLMPQPWTFLFLLLSLNFYCRAEHHTLWNTLFLIMGQLSCLCPLSLSSPFSVESSSL